MVVVVLPFVFIRAQSARVNQFADIAGAVGSSQGTVALSYVYNWQLGKKQKWEAGLGLKVDRLMPEQNEILRQRPAGCQDPPQRHFLLYLPVRKPKTGIHSPYSGRW